MKLRLTLAAEANIDIVLSWYRERGRDLAGQFMAEFDRCLESIERNPLSFAKVHLDIRRILLRRFPYCVFFIATEDEVVVLACLHGHRDPKIWKGRHDA